MLRITKIILVITVAMWGLLGAFHNVLDWSGTLGAVGAVTSMETFEGGTESWQATSSPVVIWLGALFIMLSKLTAGLLCLKGAANMWGARDKDTASFAAAKSTALAGCAIAVIMLFGGFIVIAESWFELWRSDSMRHLVLDSAFRYAGLIALVALFISTRDS
ncbi:MAG TPA: DUF2165 family protein [Xanthomonadales bacterium]|nr:DUF2165 family protein [Xanthomonadales bacterium]